MKKILFAASEAVPFIKTGGLADVVGSLPKYFPQNEYDVRIILPKYACMKAEYSKGLKLLTECQVSLNWRFQYAGVLETRVNGITCYLIDNEYYFAGPSPYDNIYLDAEKFAYFCKAVLTVLPMIDFCPDIIHCHDWQTGLIPVFLDAQFRDKPFYRYIKTIQTIHNMKYQGRWYIDAVKDVTGLPDYYFTYDKLESYGKANLLKGGLVYADEITTVSRTYAREIQTQEGGEGLEGLMRARKDHLTGICNGIDYYVYDPKNDHEIASMLDQDTEEYKAANKKALQKKCGLKEDPSAFLIGMVTRMTDQKGLDLVDYMQDQIMEMADVQMVFLGTGEKRYEDMIQTMASHYPGRAAAMVYYSEEMAHQIYAGSDAFLMPSLFEPCGLSQMISLRYGTVPMVRETGGLQDTVEAYNEFEHTGTGFRFHNYNAHEMLHMIRYAHKIFTEYPGEWQDIRMRGMKQDFSWNHSAREYTRIYDRLYADAQKQKQQDMPPKPHAAKKKVTRKSKKKKAARKKSGTARK